MTAGGLPTVQVLLDDGTGSFPYDISTYARTIEGITGARGRQDELSTVSAPQPVLTLDNQDGRFSYGSTLIASPSPILIDQQVRVKYTANATTVNRYTGTLIADQLSWPGGGDEFAIVNVTLADVQAQAERRILRSVLEEEVMLDSPVAYYTLGDPVGASGGGDTSGGGAPVLAQTGTGTAVTFGADAGPPAVSLTAAHFAGGKYLQATLESTPAAVECWFSTTTNDGSVRPVLWPFYVQSGHLLVGAVDLGAVANGVMHYLMLNGTTLYLDNVAIATLSALSATLQIGGTANQPPAGFIGTIAHVAAYGSALSTARITAHYQAGTTGFAGESGVARITRIAGYVGIPLGTLDASLTNMPPA